MDYNPNNACGGKYGKSIDVKFINECNGDCFFCIEKGGYNPKTRSVPAMIKAINSKHIDDHENVLILGGEPMLDPKGLLELLRGIKDNKKVFITTNGTVISNKDCYHISLMIDAINISIMHFDPEKNKSIMGVNTDKEDLIRMIKIYNDSKTPVRLNCNLMKGGIDNIDDAIKMMEFAKEVGFNSIRFAELQDTKDRFIFAKEIFEGVHKDPFTQGCEQVMTFPYYFDGDVTIKSTCFYCNEIAPKPKEEPTGRKIHTTSVVYCDGTISSGWVKETKIIKNTRPVERIKIAVTASGGCHPHIISSGCHTRSAEPMVSYSNCHSGGGCHY